MQIVSFLYFFKIYKAVSESHQSLNLLSEGNLEAGFLKAKSAFIASG